MNTNMSKQSWKDQFFTLHTSIVHAILQMLIADKVTDSDYLNLLRSILLTFPSDAVIRITPEERDRLIQGIETLNDEEAVADALGFFDRYFVVAR